VVALAAAVHGGGGNAFAGAGLAIVYALGAAWALAPDAAPADQAGAWVQVLRYTQLVLARVPSLRPSANADGLPPGAFGPAQLWEQVILPAVRCPHAAVRCARRCCARARLLSAASRSQAACRRHSLTPPPRPHPRPSTRRREALRAAALFALADPTRGSLLPAAALCAAALAADTVDVHESAVQGLGDLALLYGPATVDRLLSEAPPVGAAAGRPAAGVVGVLLARIDAALAAVREAPEAPVRAGRKAAASAAADAAPALPRREEAALTAAAEALAKLLLHAPLHEAGGVAMGAPDAQRALLGLLSLQFHAASEGASRLRQCLAVFLETAAACSPAHRRALAAAVLPAAHAAHAAAGAKSAAPQVVKYAATLLEAPVPNGAPPLARPPAGPPPPQTPLAHAHLIS